MEAKETEQHTNVIDSNFVRMSFKMGLQRLNMFLQDGSLEAQYTLKRLLTWGE